MQKNFTLLFLLFSLIAKGQVENIDFLSEYPKSLDYSSYKMEKPEEWLSGGIIQEDGSELKGRVLYKYKLLYHKPTNGEKLVKNVVLGGGLPFGRKPNSDAAHLLEDGSELSPEAIYLYHNNRISTFTANTVTGFFIQTDSTHQRSEFLSLPYQANNQPIKYSFFQLLVEGNLSLLVELHDEINVSSFKFKNKEKAEENYSKPELTYYYFQDNTTQKALLTCPDNYIDVQVLMPKNTPTDILNAKYIFKHNDTWLFDAFKAYNKK